MKNFDARAYSIADFLEWNNNGLLDLSPEFQRRSVWATKAKSYLIDTIIRGKPIPKILITQNLIEKRNIRTVVDGQQRLRAILGYINGDFKISSAHNNEYANKEFHDLPEDIQSDFYKYEIGVDLLFDVPLTDLLDIFARINTYTVKLNPQEKINANYLGFFKKYAYSLGYKYVNYFIEGGVVTKDQVARMKEAELSSDLLVSICGGIQSNKSIETYYKKFEESESDPLELREAEVLFNTVMSHIGAIYDADQLSRTNWCRVHLFYSLFTAIAHGVKGISGIGEDLRPNITQGNIGKIRVILDEISEKYDRYTLKDAGNIPNDYKNFIDYSRRRTTDTLARKERAKFICQKLRHGLSSI